MALNNRQSGNRKPETGKQGWQENRGRCLIIEPDEALRFDICNLLLQAGYSPVAREYCLTPLIRRIRPKSWLALILDWNSMSEQDLGRLKRMTDARSELKVILTVSVRQTGELQTPPPGPDRTPFAIVVKENVRRDLPILLGFS